MFDVSGDDGVEEVENLRVMLSRSIFRYVTCTKLLGSSSKLRTSDSTVPSSVVEQSEI